MDTTILVELQFEEGKKLLQKLDESGYKLPIAFWTILPENTSWELRLGMPKLKITGELQLHKIIHKILSDHSINLSFANITLVDTTDPLCKMLRRRLKTGWDLQKIPYFGYYFNGYSFPDSIIYRVN